LRDFGIAEGRPYTRPFKQEVYVLKTLAGPPSHASGYFGALLSSTPVIFPVSVHAVTLEAL